MSSEEDRWHVRFAPGEVKLLTLEQIDDLFRLDMIDEDTLLRQDGTEQWLPLRVVAGLDEEAPPAPVVRSPPPPPPASNAPPPPSARSAPPPPVRSAPPAPVRSAPPPPPPAPPPVHSAPPPPPAPLPPPASERAPFAPSPSFIPPAPVLHGAPPPPSYTAPLPSVPSPSFALAAASSAVPVSIASPALRPRVSRTEPLLIALVAVLGLVLTLHRNGVLASLCVSAGQAAAYDRLETTLGGPGFGTPRAVDALVGQAPSLAGSTPPSGAKR